MASSEKTSAQAAAIAQRAMQNPKSLTPDEVQTLAASVLAQSQSPQDRQQGGQQSFSGQQNPQGQGQQRK